MPRLEAKLEELFPELEKEEQPEKREDFGRGEKLGTRNKVEVGGHPNFDGVETAFYRDDGELYLMCIYTHDLDNPDVLEREMMRVKAWLSEEGKVR